MKLLVDAHVFDGKFQGTRTYIEGLYKNAANVKCLDFYFAAQDTDNLRRYFAESDNVHYIRLGNGGSIKRLALEFPQIIRDYGIDVAHFQYVLPLQKRCKEIVTTHDILFVDYPQFFPLSYRLKNNILFRHSAKRADLLLTVSEYSKQQISKHFGIDSADIGVTPNGVLMPDTVVDSGVLTKHGLNKYILTVGRIEPRKNHLMLLQSFVELGLHERGFKLVMVGVPDLEARDFNAYYSSLDERVRDKICIFSASYAELMDLYKHATLFVFPSFAEGFGIPPIEASALGCPVLCSNATAMSEFDFYKDCLYDPHNKEEMKVKMMQMLDGSISNDFDFAHIYKERYDWSIISDRFFHIVKERFL